MATAKPTKQSKPLGSVQAFAAAAECLKTLAHPVRLRMVQLLLHGRYTVGEIAEDCEVPDNVASENLRLLQRCGFLDSEREGRKVFYEIAESHLAELMNCVEGRFLNGQSKDQ
ncbi:Biofilm growth-associated repressor [Novipirellula aureliae]|uniref:Biofilm growth-associated repressor n=1 Tax=Novipirellula aureliae TaxID=2527966 RepID=A0A5C6E5Y8_9BACT|nr:metalloregulator ArsR/SmtB family transcription factor [Novipirellula aureliae]TWU44240.1 Biofilm growth-associated repressor [Novipirellula aureliae]